MCILLSVCKKPDVLNKVRRTTVYKDLHLHISGNHVLVKNAVYTEVKRGNWKSSWESQYRPDAQLLFLIQAILMTGCQDPTICHAPTAAGLQRLPWQKEPLGFHDQCSKHSVWHLWKRKNFYTEVQKQFTGVNFRDKTFVLGTKICGRI